MKRVAGAVAALVCAGVAHAAPDPGWRRIEIPATDRYALRYLPVSLDPAEPAPLILFLHGAGARPEQYRDLLAPAAEAAGAVVVVPRSAGLGWGTAADDVTIAMGLEAARAELAIDPRRISIAGHSAGGAYAYLYAYGRRAELAGVFILSSPFYPVSAVADPSYAAPVRMYYGTTDPNFSTAYPRLVEQWERLGVPWSADLRPGFGHSAWPPESLADGFRFLVAQSYPFSPCAPSDEAHCLDGHVRIRVSWRDFTGRTGIGHVAVGLEHSAVFWFFRDENWELLVKVLDGCAINGHLWVFAAAATNVEFTLTVEDLAGASAWTFHNPLGRAAPPVQDLSALRCP